MQRTLTLSLGVAALLLATAPAPVDAAGGEDVFNGSGCTDCHYTQGPAREKTIDDQLAKKGPELWYAGSKFQDKWLRGWLADPEPIRTLKFNSMNEDNPGDHPKLAKEDADAVADFLMTLTSDEVKKGSIKAKRNPKGRLIFVKKMPCSGCHQFPAKKRAKFKGGRSGPTLIGASKRLNPDWIYAYLMNPTVFKPVKMMPVFNGILRDKDIKSVARHVASFK